LSAAPEPAAPTRLRAVSGGAAAPAPSRAPGRSLTLRRLAFLLPSALAMLAGVDAGLLLLGVPAPVTTTRLPVVHGMLMTLGFVGALIALERAVALGRAAGYTAPAFLGLGSLLTLTPLPLEVGQAVLLAGATALTLLYLPLWRRQPADAVTVQALGAVLATGAALLWLGGVAMPSIVPWLAGFLVLTIAGERLELARVGGLSRRAEHAVPAIGLALVVATLASLLWPPVGYPLLGATLLALVGALVAHDIARRTIRSRGLPRFMAACMLAGYAWLAVAGATWLLTGPQLDGTAYDAVAHAVFLGFTISMIMGHAPMILPAVLRRPLPYHPVLIVPAVLLHASLVLRLVVGDLRGVELARQIGGALNVVALLLFAVLVVWSTARPRGGRRW
jgi:hypothetical protein